MTRIFTNEDCMDVMARYPDKYFDLVIVDPPYGIGNFIPQGGSHDGNYSKKVRWNDKIPDKKYFLELQRVSKERIIWGANYYNCFEKCNGAIVWYKHTTNPLFSKCEIASTTKHKRVEYVDILWQNITKENCEHRWHPCTKPVSLYKWLLKNYAEPNDLLLDTHVGSASSLIAFEDCGFEYVGCELDKDYYDAACARIKDYRAQLKLPLEE